MQEHHALEGFRHYPQAETGLLIPRSSFEKFVRKSGEATLGFLDKLVTDALRSYGRRDWIQVVRCEISVVAEEQLLSIDG